MGDSRLSVRACVMCQGSPCGKVPPELATLVRFVHAMEDATSPHVTLASVQYSRYLCERPGSLFKMIDYSRALFSAVLATSRETLPCKDYSAYTRQVMTILAGPESVDESRAHTVLSSPKTHRSSVSAHMRHMGPGGSIDYRQYLPELTRLWVCICDGMAQHALAYKASRRAG
ncbi:hypothetical protein CLAFUW4_01478 [Fulvia fulva]|uniref:Uncharacterized protein n=1 Tax=Passalora fulva TaxID=5499 RepID=A0A9Q8P493_PASFU|nr:uncharacterized protein CLAFUR5_01480 [Fulvia fulva]KAK4636148.1 hypothetical protein CLAFUR4_01479 [Fulvia fulva]KAK4636418.1 hypothetical protein CLAFUR0_01480 [Fulvia fulva]UJO12614.1 hypothetical protein CLAFUR5_01480 [Fulvia fulva]WPV08177.1 hypothetical protein CLAFUW4_01478 [Fulvia fulva]WPV23729.1 hypothetical protein CLAFUW7_01483 [Fulvia fulva]